MTSPSGASATGPRSTSPFAPDLRFATIGATALISLLALEYIAVGAAMPSVARALDGYDLYNMAFAATVAASVIGMVAAGWWSDHAGPRPPVVTGALAFAVGLLVCGLAPTMEVFVAGRALQGLGNGLAIVAIYVVIAQQIPESVRPRVFALLAAAWVVPGLAGPLFTGAVVDQWGWRWVFLLVAPVTALALLVLMPALRGTHETNESPYLSRGVVVAAVAAAVSVALLNVAGDHVSRAELAAGVVLLAGLAFSARLLLPRGTLAVRRGLPATVAVRGLLGASFVSAEAYLPLMMQEQHGYSPARAGAVLAVASLAWAAGSGLQGRLPESTDRHRVMLLGVLVYLASIVGVATAVGLGWRGWTVIALYGCATLGVGLAYPTTTLLTMQLSPAAEIGRNSSALQVSEALTSALGLAGTGVVFGHWHGRDPRAAFTATAVVAVLLGLAAVLASLRSRGAAPAPVTS